MRRKKNMEVMIQFFILAGIAIVLLYGMLSGKINNYVHPRFCLGLWISIIVLFAFALSMLFNMKKPRHNVNLIPYGIYLVPLLIAFIFPDSKVNADMVMAESRTISNLDTNKADTEVNQSDITDESELESDSIAPYTTDDSYTTYNDATSQDNIDILDEASSEEDLAEKYSCYEVDGITNINDDTFANWYFDVYDHLDNFKGKRYQFLGQVYSLEGLADNQFLAGRYFMVCCAADLAGYGFICESDIRDQLEEDQWITVTGTIAECEYEGEKVPKLIDVEIEGAQAPEVEYVYFNNY